MSVTSGFYDSLNGDRKYGILELSSIFDGIISDGIYSSIGNHFVVRVSDPLSMQVIVGSGRAWFNHTWILNDIDYPLTIGDADAVLSRIDTIVLEINRENSVRASRIYVDVGTLASNPKPGTLVSDHTVKRIPLAYINVNSKASSIRASDITNNVGTSKCPFVTGILSTVSTDELVSEWESKFETMFAELQNQIDQVVQGIIPDGSVSSTYKILLNRNDWTETGDDAYQTLSIPGIKSTDNPIVDMDLSNKSVSESLALNDQWLYYKGTSGDGTLIIRFVSKPDIDIPIKIMCIRK